MKKSADSKTILIENPLTGNDSFSTALKLKSVDGVDRWSHPQVGRKKVEGWNEATKIVLVRDVQERFESGATLAWMELECGELKKEFKEFSEWLESTSGATPQVRAERVLEFIAIEGFEKVPVYLHPQTNWLKSKVDLVIATHDIAGFFNKDGEVCCVRSNLLKSQPGNESRASLPADFRPNLFEVYAEDFTKFDTLPLWSPDDDQVRLLSGYCQTCTEKRKAQKAKRKSQKVDKPDSTV